MAHRLFDLEGLMLKRASLLALLCTPLENVRTTAFLDRPYYLLF